MKKFIFSAALLTAAFASAQNTGIGTTKPDASAQLEVNSPNKGMLLPRLALTSTTVAAPVTAPANGLTVFNTATAGDVTPGYYFWDGTKWVKMLDAKSLIISNNIYTSDGTLQANRTVDMNGKNLNFAGNGNIGVNNAAPTFKMDVVGLSAADAFNARATSATLGNHAYFTAYSANGGSLTNPNYVTNGNVLGSFNGRDYKTIINKLVNGSSEGLGGSSILMMATENYSAAAKGSNMLFYNTPNGASSNIERMRIEQNGFVGINNALPKSQLDVSGGIRAKKGAPGNDDGNTGYSFELDGDTGLFAEGGNNVTGSDVIIRNDGGQAVTVKPSGNVGIGMAAPSEKLQVGGNIRVDALAGSGDRVVIADANGVLKAGSVSAAQANSKWTNDATNQLVKLNNLSNGSTARTDAQNILIKDNGNVGIGGNSLFGFKLDVQGIAAAQSHFSYGGAGTLADHPSFRNLVAGSGGTFVTQGTVLGDFGNYDFKSVLDGIANGGTNIGGSFIQSFATQNFTAASKGSDMRFYTTNNNSANATEKMRLDENGNVGIGGDTSLGFKLDVKGLVGAPTFASYNRNNGSFSDHSNFVGLTSKDTSSNYVTANAFLGEFSAYDSKSYFAKLFGSSEGQGGASIRTISTEDYTATSKGTRMLFSTTNNGTDNQTVKFAIENNGNVGIGVADVAKEKLEVNGNVKATKFISATNTYPDYVFQNYYTNAASSLKPEYKFSSLAETESYIKENGHLPGFEKAEDVIKKGSFDVSETSIKSLEKIEELYLHMIEMNKKIEKLEKENAELKAALSK